MRMTKRNSIQFSCSRVLFLYYALLLLAIPLRLLVASIISAAVHELFHIAVISIMRIPVHSIHIGVRGAKIHTPPMTQRQEFLSALSGPLGGLLLFLFFRWIPIISLCALVQSLYNLLPLYPTDGGRMLRCGAELVFSSEVARKVVAIIEFITLSAIVAVSVYGSLWLHLGIVPLIFASALLLSRSGMK